MFGLSRVFSAERRLQFLGWMSGAIGVVAVLLLGMRTPGAQAVANEAPPPAAAVTVAAVESQDAALWDDFSGRLESIERVSVRARVSGPVQQVHFREGELVKKGDLLVTVDPEPYAAAVQRAQAQVAVATERAAYTKIEFDRAQHLSGEGAISRREYDADSNAWREAEASLLAAKAELRTATLDIGYTQVRAPVSGRMGKIDTTVGNLVAAGPNAAVLTTLVSIDPIYASFDADENIVVQALRDVRAPGSKARGSLDQIPVRLNTIGSSATVEGHLQLIDNQVDTSSGTIRVRAVFPNPDGELIPGQFAQVHLGQAKPRHVLLISERAIGTEQSKKFVMVVGSDNKASYREITVGPRVAGLRVVNTGLQAGEHVVVSGLQRIRPGAPVQPTVVTMASVTTHALN